MQVEVRQIDDEMIVATGSLDCHQLIRFSLERAIGDIR